MADLTITAANVKQGTNANVAYGTAGVSITAGQSIYLDASTGKYVLTDSDGTGTRQADGIALHAAAADQPIALQKGGDITIGATLSAGTFYVASDTAGGIMPQADLGVGMDVILLGIAKTSSVMALAIRNTGVEL